MRLSHSMATAALALHFASACGGGTERGPDWNVLLISIDTLRADHLSGYGYARRTSPHIDALAESSWLFETAYVPVPRTGPSVAALLTGSFPEHVNRWTIPEGQHTLAEVLSERGWSTMAAVDNANLSRSAGYDQGFDVYIETWEERDSEVDRTKLITEAALEHLRRFASTDRRFFIWLHYVNPHSPYTPPPEYDARFMNDEQFDGDLTLPRSSSYIGGIRPNVYVEGEHRLAYYVAQYDGEVAYTDDQVGIIMDALQGQLLDDTLVILTADHGEGLGEQNVYFKHGPHVLESHVRVPLVVRHPDGSARPRRIHRPVSTIDVMPTILDLLGLPDPQHEAQRATPFRSGQSLAGADEGRLPTRRRQIFFASRNFWGVRFGDWKFIQKTRDDAGELGAALQLFDMVDDPGELENLYGVDAERSARMLQLVEAGRGMLGAPATDGDAQDRFEGLGEEALKNLRALGYLR